MSTLRERFARFVSIEPNSGCWLWTGNGAPTGYGLIGEKGKTLLAHRASWELHRGEIPTGQWVLHRCDVRACVNPAHLFLGSAADNVGDMMAKGRMVIAGGRKSAPVTRSTEPQETLLLGMKNELYEAMKAQAEKEGVSMREVFRRAAGYYLSTPALDN